jgi:hypothetical protein
MPPAESSVGWKRNGDLATREEKMGHRSIAALGSLCSLAWLATPQPALADGGGASFWLPGIFGSLAAVPGVPGWAYTTLYVHESEAAGAQKNFVVSGRTVGAVAAGLNAHADVLVQGLTYVSPMPVLGGQASFSILGAGGNVGVGIGATLTGPLGNSISGAVTDNRTTFTDVFYQGALKWNQGVHNEMVYFTGNIPSGTYDANRLANLSFGYVAYDAGAGYTYFDPKTGHEFSVVGGVTYNLMNPTCSTRTVSIFTSSGPPRNSSARMCRSGWPDISFSSSPAIAVPAPSSGPSGDRRSASVRRSVFSFPSARVIRAILI